MATSGFSRNHALLVGIGSYPEGSGWCDLSSVEDLQLIASALPSSFDVENLTDGNATKSGIIHSLERLAENTVSGDTIIVHFSAHGQQMLTSDKAEVDGLDEAIVTYDAQIHESPEYHGEKHFRDDELAGLIDAISLKAGREGLVFVSIDACHSGDMDRGASDESSIVYRGVEDVFGAENLSESDKIELRNRQYEAQNSQLKRSAGQSKVIYFSACLARQRNRQVEIDGKQFGSLSTAITRSLKQYPMANIEVFLNNIYNVMYELRLSQTPDARNNFGYKAPVRDNIPSCESAESESNPTKWILWIGGGIVAIVLLFLVVVLWRKKKINGSPESY